MIVNWYWRWMLIKCEKPGCKSDTLPFPISWMNNLPDPKASMRTFAAACGWSYTDGHDFCLECTEAAKEEKTPAST